MRLIGSFLDWDGHRLVLHPAGAAVDFNQPIEDIENWNDTYAFIDDAIKGTAIEQAIQRVITHKDSEFVILLIRPSGFANVREICGYIQKHHELDLGYEPVNQQWRVDISSLWRSACTDDG